MINDKLKVTLNGSTYTCKMDLAAVAQTQYFFNYVKPDRDKKEFLTVPKIFDGVLNTDLSIIDELLIQSILRIHKQLTREQVLDNMKLSEMNDVIRYVAELVNISMPTDDKKKRDNGILRPNENEKDWDWEFLKFIWYSKLNRTDDFYDQLPKDVINQIEQYGKFNGSNEDDNKTVVNSTELI